MLNVSDFRVAQGRSRDVGAAVAAVGAARARAGVVAGRARARLHPGHQRAQAGAGALPRARAAPARHARRPQGASAAAGLHAEQQRAAQAGGARLGRRVRRHRRHRAARGQRRLLRAGGGRGERRDQRGRGVRAPGRQQQQLGRREPPVRVPALRQEVPLEVHAAAARERGVRRQAAGAPVPVLLLPRQAARQPGRAHPQAPQQRVVPLRHQQGSPQQEDVHLVIRLHIRPK